MPGILARLVPGLFVVALLAACGARPVAEPAQPTIALEPFQLSVAGMERAAEARCAILTVVDQRGTGSSNPLHCPDAQDSLTEELSDDAALAWSQECLVSLEADPPPAARSKRPRATWVCCP